jgi:hypothetical protein
MDALRRDTWLRDTQPQAQSARTFAWCKKAMDRFKGRRAKRMIRAQRFCSDRRTRRNVAASEARSPLPARGERSSCGNRAVSLFADADRQRLGRGQHHQPECQQEPEIDWDFMFSSRSCWMQGNTQSQVKSKFATAQWQATAAALQQRQDRGRKTSGIPPGVGSSPHSILAPDILTASSALAASVARNACICAEVEPTS